MSGEPGVVDVFLVVGEESGDQLGARLMEAIIRQTGGRVHFTASVVRAWPATAFPASFRCTTSRSWASRP